MTYAPMKTVTVKQDSSHPAYGSCSGCPGVVIRWADSGAHSAWHKSVGADPSQSPRPIWQDEFTGTDLSWATNTGGGSWRTKGYETGNDLGSGYVDYAGSSYNVNPAQAKQYDLVSVKDSILTLKAMRNPGISGVNAGWIGSYLVTNHLTGLSWRNGYFEVRARFPNPVRGMFPAIWMFNNVPSRTDGKDGAEIDLLEIFGTAAGKPWMGGIHWEHSGLSTGVHSRNVTTNSTDTTDWHRYGLERTSTSLTYYRDGTAIATLTGEEASWFATADLGIRLNYAMDPSWVSATDSTHTLPTDPPVGTKPSMEVDYVRVFSSKPPSLPTGNTDPLAT